MPETEERILNQRLRRSERRCHLCIIAKYRCDGIFLLEPDVFNYLKCQVNYAAGATGRGSIEERIAQCGPGPTGLVIIAQIELRDMQGKGGVITNDAEKKRENPGTTSDDPVKKVS